MGPYEIVAPLGAGGMGEVFRARDSRLNRDVALKILPESFFHDAARRARLKREARAASALNHPNIITVYDIGEEGDVSYIVTELVEGESLRALIERGPRTGRVCTRADIARVRDDSPRRGDHWRTSLGS